MGLDFVLLVSAIVVVVLDIILALCLRFVLPYHITSSGWYPAHGEYFSFDEGLQYCPSLVKYFPEGTVYPIRFAPIPKQAKQENRRKRRSITKKNLDEDIKQYPFLVSLSIPVFSDDPEQKMFACNGLVQSISWLLTSKNCVKEDSEWYNLTVRSGSPFWSEDGTEHKVVEVRSEGSSDPVFLKVVPQFSETVVPFPPIEVEPSGHQNWTYAVSLGWEENMYAERYKYKVFDVEKWTRKNCGLKKADVCSKTENYRQVGSKILLTSCHQVIGIKADTFEPVFIRNSKSSDEAPKCYPIYEDSCGFKEAEDCQVN